MARRKSDGKESIQSENSKSNKTTNTRTGKDLPAEPVRVRRTRKSTEVNSDGDGVSTTPIKQKRESKESDKEIKVAKKPSKRSLGYEERTGFIHPLDKPVAYKPSFAHVKLRNGDKTIVAFRNDTIREFAENTLDVCVKLTKREIEKLPETVYFWEYATHNLHELQKNEKYDPSKPIFIPS